MTKKSAKETKSFADTMRKFRRGPQIITPKDAAQIVAATGLCADWKCADLGGGSGFLSLFLANLLTKGKMTIYEIREKHAKIIKNNILESGLKNIKVKNEDAGKISEKSLDLITVDMKGAENIVSKCTKALKKGGFLCVYSPHMEQQKEVVRELEKTNLRHVKTIETIQREWQVSNWTHPVPSQVVHTGFITIARKDR